MWPQIFCLDLCSWVDFFTSILTSKINLWIWRQVLPCFWCVCAVKRILRPYTDTGFNSTSTAGFFGGCSYESKSTSLSLFPPCHALLFFFFWLFLTFQRWFSKSNKSLQLGKFPSKHLVKAWMKPSWKSSSKFWNLSRYYILGTESIWTV